MTKVIEKHEFLKNVNISLDQDQKRETVDICWKPYNCHCFLTKMLIVDIQVCPKRYYSLCFSFIWNSSPDLPEVSHLLRFGTSSTRAGGQDDVSSKKLPQTIRGLGYPPPIVTFCAGGILCYMHSFHVILVEVFMYYV